MLLFVPPEKQQQIKDVLPGYLHVPFKFESKDQGKYKKGTRNSK